MGVEFRAFGEFEMRIDDQPVDLGHARQRCLLLALLVDANQVVSVDQLVSRVWAERAPQRVRGAVHSYVSRLRQILAAGGDAAITRRSGGYLLAVDPLAVDLHLFDHLIARARAADDPEASDLFARALSLYRGEVFAALDTPWLNALRDALDNRRAAAVLDRNDVELRRGRQSELLPDLTAQAAVRPLDERLAGQLMLALYRCGRQADALDHYGRTRARLAEELGIDPGPALRALHQQILTADATLDVPAAQRGVPAGQHTVLPPRQVPAPPRSFTGRGRELAELDALLHDGTEHPADPRIGVISGVAGVGKTSLAVFWAHRVADRFPDGQLYVNLRGFDPCCAMMDPAVAVRAFLDALGVPAARMPQDPDMQAALYRTLLANKRMLILLDNARDAEQVRPLLPGTPGCAVVVTSRDQLTPLVAAQGARPLTVDLLDARDARALLASRLGEARVAAEPAAVEEIIAHCGRLPLALGIAAARAATRPTFALASLATQLRDSAARLDTLRGGDRRTDLRHVFSWSYRSLNPGAARLFRLLGLHPGPDIGEAAAASLAALSYGQVRDMLRELCGGNLLTEPVPGRYALHDLLRVYAAEVALAEDAETDRRSSLRRALDHYLHTAQAVMRMLHGPWCDLPLPPPDPGVVPELPADPALANAWFDAEHQVLIAAIGRAGSDGFETHTWQLAWTLTLMFNVRGLWRDYASTQEVALEAVLRTGDLAGQAHAHHGVGRAYTLMGREQDGMQHLWSALDLYRLLGDEAGQGNVHLGIGWFLDARKGDVREGMRHDQIALELFRSAGHRSGEALTLSNLGWDMAMLGDYPRALVYCEQGLELHQELGDLRGLGGSWDCLGLVRQHLHQYAEAITCYQNALALLRQTEDRVSEADVLTRLGDAHVGVGDAPAARTAWRQALAILDELGHPDAEKVRDKLTQRLIDQEHGPQMSPYHV